MSDLLTDLLASLSGESKMEPANPCAPIGGDMARRRYQRGSVTIRGKREPVWVGQWREDVVKNGIVERVRRKEVLGSKKDYPTKKLALRELERRLSEINDPDYRPRPTATFREFAEQWQGIVGKQHDASTQKSDRSRMKRHLIPVLGGVKLKDINTQLLQSFVSTHTASPKSVRNLIALLRSMWTTAKAWEHVRHDPFAGLVLPKYDRTEQPAYSESDLARIIATATAPYNVICWLLWETGIRRGEVCALDVGHIDLTTRIIVVRYSMSGTEIKTTKSRRPRVFSLSPELGEALRFYVEGRGPAEPLFLTANSKRLHPDNFVKRELRPVLASLGLAGGCHAFRHGNATAQDRLGTPMKVRQERLGHVDAETTMGYTHMISDDDRRVSAQLGQLIAAQMKQKASGIWPQLAPTSEMQAV